MKRMLKVATIAITLITCTSCSASAKDRQKLYTEFSDFSPEYTNFVESVSDSLNCNPWDIQISKHLEYNVEKDNRGMVVSKKNVPVYAVCNCNTGEEVEVYAPSEHTDTFTLVTSEISTEPAVNKTFCGFTGEEIAKVYNNR